MSDESREQPEEKLEAKPEAAAPERQESAEHAEIQANELNSTPKTDAAHEADAEPTVESASLDGSPRVKEAAAATTAEGESESPPPPPPPIRRPGFLEERAEIPIELPRAKLKSQSRRDFILFSAGAVGALAGAWWLLPDDTKERLLPMEAHHHLDTLASRAGLSPANRDRALKKVLTFDDDIAEALYSKNRMVRTYDRSQAGPLMNNYFGQTPDPDYLADWALEISGLASGRTEKLSIGQLKGRLGFHEQVTRLCCVEGWSQVAWWGGLRFADLLKAFPPAPEARWAALKSSVNMDEDGESSPYYVSIDLETARHPQSLLATHLSGQPLTVEHGAPLRLVVPMKLGLKNIKAITEIAYTAREPADYWNEQGYSRYDGL